MNLQEFSRDVVPILQVVISFLGLLSLLLVAWQIRETRLWNRITTQGTLTNVERIMSLERKLFDSLRAVGIDANGLRRPLTDAEIDNIYKSDDASFAVKSYLVDLEVFCAAVTVGSVDNDFARDVHGDRVGVAWLIFGPLIARSREQNHDHAFYIELEKTAVRWEEEELQKHAKQAAELVAIRRDIQKREAKIRILKQKEVAVVGAERRFPQMRP